MIYTNEAFKAGIKAGLIDLNMLSALPRGEKLRILLKPDFDTACWSFRNDTHTMYVGDKIMDEVNENYDNFENVVFKYIYHEAGHANYTTRDLEALNKKLQQEQIPFPMFNLFEDAKIEHLMRLKTGLKFNWLEFSEIPDDEIKEDPMTTFFKLVQTEGKGVFDVPYYEVVKGYYNRTVKARTDDEMIQIMKDWIKEFPNDRMPQQPKMQGQGEGEPQEGQGQNGGNQQGQGSGQGQEQKQGEGKEQEGQSGSGQGKDKKEGQGQEQGQGQGSGQENGLGESDLSIGMKLANDDEFREEFEKDCEIAFEDAESKQQRLQEELSQLQESKQSVKHLSEVKSEQLVNLAASSVDDMFDKNAPYDPKKIHEDEIPKIEKKLKDLLKDVDIESLNSRKKGKRINTPGAISYLSGNTRSKLYKKDFEEDEIYDKKKVAFVLDGSGSMGGKPVKNALTVCVALNRLCKHNVFDGYIIGSKASGRSSYNQGFKLPVNDGVLTSFRANAGSEGIGYALKQNLSTLNDCDYVFVVTDGQIHDMDLEMLKNQHKTLYDKTLCLYIGDKRHSSDKKLAKWFKHSIVEKEIMEVVSQVADILDPKKNTSLQNFRIDSGSKLNTRAKSKNAKAIVDNLFENGR